MAVSVFTPRAAWASDPARSRGRRLAEPASPSRSDFRRDCDRIIHSTAFRRLKHKTQVFVSHEGDHFRTRLTHTLEVSQIARALARSLGLDEDLAEALALSHDLGHPPFGHAGERALDFCMKDYGGFDHNAQSLRVVTKLEHRYAAFDGLNLTWETLEGIAKHNGPLTDEHGSAIGRYEDDGLPLAFAEQRDEWDLEYWTFASAEAQIAAISDDIAYDAHDLDDAMRAGLFNIMDLKPLSLAGDILRDVKKLYPAAPPQRLAGEVIRRLIAALIDDALTESIRRAGALAPHNADDVRHARDPVIAFSHAGEDADRQIKAFLTPRMYREERVMRIMTDAETIVRDLFVHFLAYPKDMEAERLASDEAALVRQIADFIAGMTDRFAIEAHRRYFDSTPDLR
ncbi:MAG: deoxyguanosinetriphosphate triphosphohydrolase [Xanthobacteraceae bacterium]|nr:deoxyguanosinetriphosphate triphosphohydrolase [Xanthobacteraceae bacterium]